MTKSIEEVIIPSGTVDPRKNPDMPFQYVDVSGISNRTFKIEETTELFGKDAPSRARRLIKAGDVLFATIRPTLRRIAVVPEELDGQVCSTGYFVFRARPEIDGRFLYYYLFSDTFMDAMAALQSGASYPAVNDAQVRKQKISFPPLPEQQRIVTILDQAFDSIATAKANTEKNLKNTREIFESHLNAVFTQRGEGWVETTLGKIGKVSMCKRIFKEQTTASGDIPFYKIGTFGKEPDAFIPTHIYEEYRKKFSFPKKGDILISASGTIGRRVRYDGMPAYFQDSNIVWVDNDETQVLNDFLYHFYGGCEWNSTKGATISRLYNDNLRQVEIAFPKSLVEQRDIICTLDALVVETQRLEAIYQQKLTALDELKKSFLHQAFTGELTTLPDKQLDEALT